MGRWTVLFSGFAALLLAIAAAPPLARSQTAAGVSSTSAAGPIDFSTTPRTIGKLPAFKAAKPLYGLFLFGSKGETRVWAVLDKSRADAPAYDLLYLDRNANGDLTDDGERFERTETNFNRETQSVFTIGRFIQPGQPGTGNDAPRVHTDFSITWTPTRVSWRMNWNGGPLTMGCYGPDSQSYGSFTDDPKTAPILVPGHDLPFQFELWDSRDLARGSDNMFRVFVGNRGSVKGAFSTVDDKFLKPDEFVIATLLYKDQTGKERNVRYELRERC
jgi:hypothetical protein